MKATMAYWLLLMAILPVLHPLPAIAAPDSGDILVVGTREIPPFAMLDKDGNWTGITVELWEMIAGELGLSYRYTPVTVSAMLEGLQSGELNVAAAALSITSERETVIDFSHPFYYTGLGIAVNARPKATWRSVARGLFSLQFINVLGVLLLILFIAGFLVWLCERRRNQAQFGGNAIKGIGAGLWWSAVTMTTVGYGDKAPITPAGRLIALIWMFSGIIVISSITAAITSALTVASLDTGIQGPQDLPRANVGTIRATTSEDYFAERGMKPKLFDTVQEALAALAAGEIEAVVYDKPILAYLINRDHPGRIAMLPTTFDRQPYGIALPFNSAMRQDINRALLAVIEDGRLEQITGRYLGE